MTRPPAMPEILIADPALLADVLAVELAAEARDALARHGTFTLAVPGGSVAETFFPRLARAPLDWSRVEFFWTDERAVPPDHPDSNHALARRLWLDPAGVPPARVHRMPGEARDLAAAARAHAGELSALAGSPPRLDFVLLGMGPDGHVASLFPDHPALGADRQWVVAVEDAPKAPPRRLSLTLPVIAGATRVVVAAFGEAKANVAGEAVARPDSPLPVACVLRAAARPLLLLDHKPARLAIGEARPPA